MDMDKELICGYVLHIAASCKKICEAFPKENEYILKHVAAASLHMALFMRDFHEITYDTKICSSKEDEQRFFNECGCGLFNKDQ